MNRLISLVALLTWMAGMTAMPPDVPGERPNIIMILTDDQRWDALGHAGNDIIRTPCMDELAREGVWFPNAFVTTPICAASRASIMTGLYERCHRFTFNTPPLARELARVSYPWILKEHGYHTGFIGKFGMTWEERLDTVLFDFYSRPGEQSWATTYYRLNPEHTGFRHLSTEIGDLSLRFLEEYASKGPFCLSISFHAPHAEDCDPRQYIYPLETDSLYRDEVIPPPMYGDPSWFEAQPPWVREGLNRVRWYWRFDTEEKYQRMVKGYYRMISGVDRQIGRIREELERLSVAGQTIIILLGDNGYFLGERGFAGKWLMYEPSLRVPLVVYDPVSGHQGTCPEMALNIDIAPTILGYAGIPVPGQVQGADLREVMGADPGAWREAFLCEHLFDHPKIPRSEGIRTTRHKYFRYLDHPSHEELYDLEADPLEAVNLAGDPRYRDHLMKLRGRCDELVTEYAK
jgi:arylsulfatase A-like enzyme